MRKGSKSHSLGSIGVAGGFAVFPDYQTGRVALRKLLQTTYSHWSLYRLVKKYAPPTDKNDVANYRRLLRKFTGFDLKRAIHDLNSKEIEILLNAIQRIEGFESGEEEFLEPPKKIIDVQRDGKNQITGYVVEDLGLLTPIQTVKGILSGEIDGVVAHRAGRTYVRTRPDSRWDNNLGTMGRR
jgi:hypothetical protein